MSQSKTYLIADCGHSVTTVALYKVADGGYRLISRAQVPSTITDPTPDVKIGLVTAIREIEAVTGHELLQGGAELIRNTTQAGRGVDYFGLTTSAATPLRVAIVAPSLNDPSVDSVRRLVQEISNERVMVFARDDGRDLQHRIDELGQLRPNLIIMAHGPRKRVQADMIKLAEAVRFGQRQLAKSDRAKIIYTGHESLQEIVEETLTDEFPLIAVSQIRPQARRERLGPLRQAIQSQLQDIKLCQVPGMQGVIQWGGDKPTATIDSLVDVVQYRATVREGKVLLVDLEQDDLILIYGENEEIHTVNRPEFGVGKPLARLLDYIEPEQFFHWLPQEIEDVEALKERFMAYLINQSFFPDMIPMVDEEFHFLQAIMRTVIAQAWQDALEVWGVPAKEAVKLQTIIVRGRPLMMIPKDKESQIIHLLLDAIQPVGMASVVLDRYGVLPTVGKLAEQDVMAAVQTAESGVLLNLGWAIGVGGWRLGSRATTLELNTQQAGTLKIEVDWGNFEVLAIPVTMGGDLEINPQFSAHVGGRYGRKETLKNVSGDLVVGVVVDARGRPLKLPKDEAERSELIKKWTTDIGG